METYHFLVFPSIRAKVQGLQLTPKVREQYLAVNTSHVNT